jgi:hypothetical protein
MSAHCSSEDSPVLSKGQRNVSPAPIPTWRPGDLIGTISRITLCKPMPDQATPVKARALRARLRRLTALTGFACPGV